LYQQYSKIRVNFTQCVEYRISIKQVDQQRLVACSCIFWPASKGHCHSASVFDDLSFNLCTFIFTLMWLWYSFTH